MRVSSLIPLALVSLLLLCGSQFVLGDGAGGSASGAAQSFVKTLTDANFEHDTQATTGSTTGDLFVEFHGACTHAFLLWSFS
jgi:hypothetical protein